ncbi:MAG: AAA family ATPase [Bacteroidales bacterium]|nr:AAA family ATPase [Bacteroidales bacterium]
MQLTKIQIENFRSIKSQTIIFDHNCLVLVGKNEAGKSNILRAISAVFSQYKVSGKDKRKRIGNEKISNYYVRAVLKLSEDDFDKILERFQKKYENTESIIFTSKKTLRDFIKTVFHEYLIRINIADEGKIMHSYWTYKKKDFDLENDIYLVGNSFNNLGVGTKKELTSLILAEIKELYDENPYNCHYWAYNDKHLLPNSISIANFMNDPTVCEPLKNIFVLSGREDINVEFTNAMAEDGDYENLLPQISEEVTQTFREIWEDFKETSIQLRPNGTEMSIKIANKAKYSCEDRSDGFKKFISILLMLSTQARTNKIGERDIILIDEPDQSLYPSSARYLRDELLKIAETSKVIYSTHSPYMIDSECIERHLIVEKKDDITTAEKQDRNAPFSKDELLNRAIGTSIFDCLQDKNIIFEGWFDKELFNKHCGFHKKTEEFKNVGKVYLAGISGVETLVQILILANKKFIIVADSDQTSNSRKKEFENNYKEFSQNWLSYADVVEKVSTMEDFFESSYISEHLTVEHSKFVYKEDKSAVENIESVTKTDKEKKQKIKNELVNKVSKENIKEDYKNFVVQVKEKLSNL